MKTVRINRARSFNKADEFDIRYYRSLTVLRRLDIMQDLRELYIRLKRIKKKRYERDYEDFIRLLNRYKVKYCIVGAFALAVYAKPQSDALSKKCGTAGKQVNMAGSRQITWG